MHILDLTIAIHQQARPISMKDAWLSLGDRSRMHATFEPSTGGLDAIHFDSELIKKWMKQANRIGTAADARD